MCFYLDKQLSFHKALPLTCAGLLIFSFGILDDLIDIRAVFKLLVQLVASGIVVANGFGFRQIFGLILPVPAAVALTFVWIVGMINAYNLIDGLDGLCGTLSLTTLVTLGILLHGDFQEGAAVCFILAAAVLGFLVFNWPPAKIFMGDGGSQLLGFMIATIPLYSNNDSFEYNKFLIMLVATSFPLLDTIAAIWRRLRDRRPIMSPDRLHLHHKLLNLGFGKVQALYMILGIQLLICATICLTASLEREIATILLTVSALFMIGFFTVIHYTNRAVLRKLALENELRNSGKTPEL
ncbi:MAG: undecaprenyl/decaprenyl-phosphate alpha-N-acetylglucosaminyl 1-phosphate transferase [Treponemataceae bacterium]|nr:undecaprenyl/decaprenyl-phosphate alpha-N-acetylglucosaminyl 1-phosphate transferase [Treponemataceae bacterium]